MLKRQKGAAAILFMCMLPIMMAFFVFSTQVVQRLQSDAKLMEATEVATLALIATSTGKNKPDLKLAESIVDRYIPDNQGDIVINLVGKHCDFGDGCMKANNELSPFTDFTLTAKSKHKSWVSFNSISSLSEDYTVEKSTIARKYLPKPVDIYFIVDMSESMSYKFGSDQTRTRIQVVKSTIKRITKELEKFNKQSKYKSRVAFIGYNHFNVQRINGINHFTNQIVNDDAVETVEQMFDSNKPLFSDVYSNSDFHDIDLTDKYNRFNREVNTFEAKAYGTTASWQGVIRAAQVTNSQNVYNAQQVIIVLSDGTDTATRTLPKTFLKDLVHEGLCTNIVQNLKNKTDREGNKVQVKFSVIGVDFLLDKSQNGFYDCVGGDNIFHAKQGEDVYKYIINLLNEETGRLKL